MTKFEVRDDIEGFLVKTFRTREEANRYVEFYKYVTEGTPLYIFEVPTDSYDTAPTDEEVEAAKTVYELRKAEEAKREEEFIKLMHEAEMKISAGTATKEDIKFYRRGQAIERLKKSRRKHIPF